MAGERAKALAAKQKAQAKAEKQRRKNSTNPQDWGQFRQMRETYRVTKEHDPQLPWLMLAAGVGGFLVVLIIGFLLKAPILWGILGVLFGFLCAMFVFVRRARKAVYQRYAGQAGSAEVALQMLGKKWIYEPVVTATARNKTDVDLIHRVIGPGGLFLIGEGDARSMSKMLASEKRKHEQVAYGVDVEVIQMGDSDGEIPLAELEKYLKKQPKRLPPAKVQEVASRLKALDAMRPKIPVPKGFVNIKGAKKAMRGR